jgi:hypothetical protein
LFDDRVGENNKPMKNERKAERFFTVRERLLIRPSVFMSRNSFSFFLSLFISPSLPGHLGIPYDNRGDNDHAKNPFFGLVNRSFVRDDIRGVINYFRSFMMTSGVKIPSGREENTTRRVDDRKSMRWEGQGK